MSFSRELEYNNLTELNKGWLYGLHMLRILRVNQNNIGLIRADAWEFCHRLEELWVTSALSLNFYPICNNVMQFCSRNAWSVAVFCVFFLELLNLIVATRLMRVCVFGFQGFVFQSLESSGGLGVCWSQSLAESQLGWQSNHTPGGRSVQQPD